MQDSLGHDLFQRLLCTFFATPWRRCRAEFRERVAVGLPEGSPSGAGARLTPRRTSLNDGYMVFDGHKLFTNKKDSYKIYIMDIKCYVVINVK